MITYTQKLKDPRWQRKRLQVLQRDSWACLRCKNDQATLHVHHKFYTKGLEPWEYADSELETLCEKCHQEEHLEFESGEGGILKVCDFIALHPNVRIYFYRIDNHEGMWTLYVRPSINLNDIAALHAIITYIRLLSIFIELVDNEIILITGSGDGKSDGDYRYNFYQTTI